MRRSLLGVAIAVVFAAGCKTQSTGSGTQISQTPLTGPNGKNSQANGTPEELPGKSAALLCITMAENLEKDGKDVDAIAYYEHARQLDPGLNEKAARRLAVLYDQNDQQAKAMIEFQELLKKRPKDSTLLSDLGYSYYNRGQWSEAESYLRQAVSADKSNKRAWVNLGMTLAQLGHRSDALSAFEKAVSPAEAQANLAFVLTSQGNTIDAMTAYRKALTLEPTHPIARAALAKLERGETTTSSPNLPPESSRLTNLPLPDGS
jgi:Flp pilus assembly protein TadD